MEGWSKWIGGLVRHPEGMKSFQDEVRYRLAPWLKSYYHLA